MSCSSAGEGIQHLLRQDAVAGGLAQLNDCCQHGTVAAPNLGHLAPFREELGRNGWQALILRTAFSGQEGCCSGTPAVMALDG